MSNLIVSPNSVLANVLSRTIDILRPKVALYQPKKIKFVVGTQINGNPHIGTNLVQCCAFVLAQHARRFFSVDTSVVFGALDNAPFDVVADPESFRSYQITYYHALGETGIQTLINELYASFFEGLAERTGVEYQIQTYSELQAQPQFREEFIRSLRYNDQLRWCVSPSYGQMHVRLPCPECNWAEKRAERTEVRRFEAGNAEFSAFCYNHMGYSVEVTPDATTYLDLSTLYRNVIKEAVLARDRETLHVMVKGGDWAFGCQPVDWALNILGYASENLPVRIFTPQIVTDTGAKLSKSSIRRGHMGSAEISPWMLETSKWEGSGDDYLDTLVWMVETLISDPKHFYRSYTHSEINRIMREKPDGSKKLGRSMFIYRKYFDMIASGEKTIEVRVGYSSMKRIKPGQLIRFECQEDDCLTRVVRVADYSSFEELFDNEDPVKINPHLGRADQLKEIRKIFTAEKESLGVIAIEIAKEPE
jgi:ASC-1-like (ASCH) protein